MKPAASVDPRRGPVEHRFLGLDKRTFPIAFSVLAVFLLFTVVVPRIDDAVSWDDPVAAGERMALTETISFTPIPGWNVESGFRAGDASTAHGEATLVGEGVTFIATPDDFDGTPRELVAQIEKVTSGTDDPSFVVDGERTTITAANGEHGVLQSYSSALGDGVVAAFVIDGTGLEFRAFGPPAQMRAAADDIQNMIASVRAAEGDDQ